MADDLDAEFALFESEVAALESEVHILHPSAEKSSNRLCLSDDTHEGEDKCHEYVHRHLQKAL
jgi:hypothetical protein